MNIEKLLDSSLYEDTLIAMELLMYKSKEEIKELLPINSHYGYNYRSEKANIYPKHGHYKIHREGILFVYYKLFFSDILSETQIRDWGYIKLD